MTLWFERTIVSVQMTNSTKNQCFTASSGHRFHPFRFFWTVFSIKVFECPNMMNLNINTRAAKFALIC